MDNNTQVNKKNIGVAKIYKDYTFAVGRRRSSVARVRVYSKAPSTLKFGDHSPKKGEININERPIENYFSGGASKVYYEKPLKLTNTPNKYIITAKIAGGGLNSQLGAFILGLSRALASMDEKNKQILRKNGLLTRDARVRERRKVGMGGKARRKKQSPKR